MNKIIMFISILLLTSFLCGCSTNNIQEKKSEHTLPITDEASSSNSSEISSKPIDTEFSSTDDDMFSNKDINLEFEENNNILISLTDNASTSTSEKVIITNNVITITADGTYTISGTLNDGMIIVDAPEDAKPIIILNNTNITSKTSAALYVKEADKVFVNLAANTSNTLNNGGTFNPIDDNNIDAAVFSKQDLTFNGSGSLEVSSPIDHGIVCKDDLVFTNGSYTINSAGHAIDANDSIRITNANFKMDSGKDGIHSKNSDDSSLGFIYISSGTFNIEAEGDGISSYAYTQIENGNFDILSGGGSENGTSHSSGGYGDFMGGGKGPHRRTTDYNTTENENDSTSMKGIKTQGGMLISDGNIKINSADDSIHSNNSIIINGGTFELSSGDDAIHADSELSVSNGTINITESYEGLEALTINITGGNIDLVASDDGLNAAGGNDSSGTGGRDNGMFGGGKPGGMGGSSNGSIVISGGNINIKASGDGIDSNGSLTISGGCTTVTGPTQGDTSTLDCDTTSTITGGTFIGTGASGMAHSFSSSENQGVIALSVGNQSAGTEIILKDTSGNIVISHKPELSYAIVILSSPEINKGETYNITIGSQSGDFEAE